MIANENYNEFI